MEVKLVHPDDPDSKVVVATNEQQVAAYTSVGFVDQAEADKQAEAKADAAAADTALQDELDATKAELAKTKTALTKAKTDLKAAQEATPPAPATANAPAANSEGAK